MGHPLPCVGRGIATLIINAYTGKNIGDKVTNLAQSTLAKAFKGKLTADWHAASQELSRSEYNSEPLLAKINAEC